MRLFLLWLLLGVGIFACNTQKTTVATTTPPPVETEVRDLDTLTVTAPPEAYDEIGDAGGEANTLPDYNASHTQLNDLLHTKLEVRFDWEKEQVIGKATLRLKPYFYPMQEVTLDAKGFEFKKVALAGKNTDLKYEYDGQQITIQLDRPYTRNEEYSLFIDYVATPAESGGSAAITSDKGLFFINPRGEEPGKPQQIWTQGETENSSRWFPTIDKPNERTTQEIYLTVDDKFKTLSNGALTSSKKNADGTRTDYWKMDQPHAPYLFMVAVGDFAIVEDKWQGIPVNYYVEPEYKDDARAIFPHTPEMLTFFSDILKMKYPWPKYSQIVVRDYVSGAMENTTAVIFGEFMQLHERELIDNRINEKIVAHELFHHWFGDLVTCESWANLTLNEGFANYSEYLWMEKKHGRDAADYHLLEEWSVYLSSAQSGIHPLIHYGYDDKEDMFDAHSYNKGGSVLHMLRKYMGDEAFFTALNKYLTEHAYTAVEVDELRMAFEEVTGEDLHWFFDQWYMREGHPQLNIEYSYNADTKEAVVQVNQTQDAGVMPGIFQLPVAIDVYTGTGDPQRHKVMINQRSQTLTFPAAAEPKLIVFDAEHALLMEKEENKTPEQLAFQYQNARLFLDRFEAIQGLGEADSPAAKQTVVNALQDPFYAIRAAALNALDLENVAPTTVAIIRQLAKTDPHSEVRSEALAKLAQIEDEQAVALAKEAVSNARAYPVVATGLAILAESDPKAGAEVAAKLENETNSDIIAAIAGIYAGSGDQSKLPYFEKRLNDVDGFSAISFYTDYQSLLAQADPNGIQPAIDRLKGIATDMGQSPWRRLASTKALSDLKQAYGEQAAEASNKDVLNKKVMELNAALEAIKAAETNEQLKGIYQQF